MSPQPVSLLRLKGKHALLTGAAGGIGLAVARAFLLQGARCTVADIGQTASAGLVQLMKAYPDSLQYVRTDLTQLPLIDTMVHAAALRFGPITTLFNNAAIFDMAPLLESNEAVYDWIFSVNVKGSFFVMQKVLAHMVLNEVKGGAVINMASQAGRRGEALVAHCGASKAAVASYTQSAALAMAPHKIRVNGIAPGPIESPKRTRVDGLFSTNENLPLGEKKQRVGGAVPPADMGPPQDICGAAVFLASDEAYCITAQTLNVDGGTVLH